MENQLSLASWVKREELMVVMKVEHFYDTILVYSHKDKANDTEQTDIAKELIGRNEVTYQMLVQYS